MPADTKNVGRMLSNIQGMVNFKFDAVTLTLSGGDTIETYAFFTNGIGGTQVGTIVITYTDSTRDVMSSAVRSLPSPT